MLQLLNGPRIYATQLFRYFPVGSRVNDFSDESVCTVLLHSWSEVEHCAVAKSRRFPKIGKECASHPRTTTSAKTSATLKIHFQAFCRSYANQLARFFIVSRNFGLAPNIKSFVDYSWLRYVRFLFHSFYPTKQHRQVSSIAHNFQYDISDSAQTPQGN